MKTGTIVPGNERGRWKGIFLTAISVCVIFDSTVMQRLSLMDSMVAGLEISNSILASGTRVLVFYYCK